jgi:hypothetical protein
VSSNGAVTRTLGAGSHAAGPVATQSIARAHLPRATALWLCAQLGEFRNALVFTFDRVGPDGEDTRGALVVERLDELHGSIGRWMAANEPYIAHIDPIEDALAAPGESADPRADAIDLPIQAMLCGTVERMRRAEARLLEHPGVTASSHLSGHSGAVASSSQSSSGAPSLPASSERVGRNIFPRPPEAERRLALQRTEYPGRDLSILDILPAGCSKGAALLALAAARKIDPSQIVAIGDNWNDVSMLEIAGEAVVMANAPEDLKALALARGWKIGPSNRGDGVAEAIEAALKVGRYWRVRSASK